MLTHEEIVDLLRDLQSRVTGLIQQIEEEEEEIEEPVRLDTSNRFIWKPISETTHRLVVILPKEELGRYIQVYVSKDRWDKNVLESHCEAEGEPTFKIRNPDRPHYFFSQPGAWYGEKLYFVGQGHDGKKYVRYIKHGDRRYE